LRNFVAQYRPAAPATGHCGRSGTEAIDKIPPAGRCGPRDLRLSGGVDSAVAAVLIHEAIGDQLTCVFVDHGLLRLGEGRKVVTLFPRQLQYPACPRGGAGAIP